MDEKIAMKDAGEDLKQIAATLLETEQSVESRVGARAQAAAADVRDKAKEVVGEIKVRHRAQLMSRSERTRAAGATRVPRCMNWEQGQEVTRQTHAAAVVALPTLLSRPACS